MKNVKIVIKDGKISIDFAGYHTDACLKDAKKIIESLKTLGIKVEMEDEQRKPESRIPDTENIRT